MAVTCTWSVPETEYETTTGGIQVIHWRCRGVEAVTGTAATRYGTTSHDPDPAAPGFIPYADVTEADAIGWAQSELDVATIEQAVADEIALQDNPIVATGTPWGTAT